MESKMKPLSSSFKNMFLVLCSITLFAGFLLSYVYSLTNEKISKARIEKEQSAIGDVLKFSYDNQPYLEVKNFEEDGEVLGLFPAFSGKEFKGAAVKSFSNKGYSGKIWLMIGFDSKGIIQKINVLEHKETPGLGTKMELPEFINQFLGKSPETFQLRVKKDGGDVDAITAATVSSRAFADAVERAHKYLLLYKKEKGFL